MPGVYCLRYLRMRHNNERRRLIERQQVYTLFYATKYRVKYTAYMDPHSHTEFLLDYFYRKLSNLFKIIRRNLECIYIIGAL